MIFFSKELVKKISATRLACLYFSVSPSPSSIKFKSFSEEILEQIQTQYTMDMISQRAAIRETKEAYRTLGKDPSRYRPSAEALSRRVVSGKGLYMINNVVDILNLISVESGFSIGGYDAEKIVGDVEFGIGAKDEPYQAIARGALNIENLPIFRDDLSAFGSPTSDSQRTMVTDATEKFLMIIIDFNSNDNLQIAIDRAVELYRMFDVASIIDSQVKHTKQG